MTQLSIRPVTASDFDAWLPLWDGYNAFYGRSGPTGLDPAVTGLTWRRFLDPAEPIHALLAEADGVVLGLAHYLFHRSTSLSNDVCYLQDLFTAPEARGQGVGRALVDAVNERARAAGSPRLYWHTHEGNSTARRLYDAVARTSGFIVYRQDIP